MPNYTQKNKATKGNMAAQLKGARPDYPDIDGDGNKTESMKQAAQDKAAQKKGNPVKKSSISNANLILNPNKAVFKPINVDYKSNMKKEIVGKSPEMAAPMKGYHLGKQSTADVKAAQQKGNPIMPEALKKNKDKYHTSGMPEFITSAESGEKINTMNIDEGNFSKITTNIPERSKVTATEGSDKYFKGEEFFVDPAKMHAQHPSKKRMENMVNKVAQYKMPNVKAAQKKYCK